MPMQRPRATPIDAEAALDICDVTLVADCGGVLYWPEERLLAVADLHFEKGSSFATRGMLLPPYDTAATLARLTQFDRTLCAADGDRARRQLS